MLSKLWPDLVVELADASLAVAEILAQRFLDFADRQPARLRHGPIGLPVALGAMQRFLPLS